MEGRQGVEYQVVEYQVVECRMLRPNILHLRQPGKNPDLALRAQPKPSAQQNRTKNRRPGNHPHAKPTHAKQMPQQLKRPPATQT